MKKLLLLTIIAVFNLNAKSQSVFFPSKEGAKLTYQTFDKKGKQSGKVIYTIKEIKGSGTQIEVEYNVESFDSKDKPMYSDVARVKQDGDKIYFEMNNLLNKSAFQQNGEIPASVEIVGNKMEIPVIPVPGITLPDADVTMSMKMGFINMKTVVLVTNRKVEAIEDVTVKAGTFKAFKISSDVSASILGIKVNTKNSDWYSYGIGLVKTESYDKKGDLHSGLELTELTN